MPSVRGSRTAICAKCARELSLRQFYKAPLEKSGHSSYCKKCSKAYSRKWYRHGPDFRHYALDHRGNAVVIPRIETWWERWNRESGTHLTREDAKRMMKAARSGAGAGGRLSRILEVVSRARGA